MVVEKETVRYFAEEQELLWDDTRDGVSGAVGSWDAYFTDAAFVTLTKPSVIVFSCTYTLAGGEQGGIKLSITIGGNDYYIGGSLNTGAGDFSFEGIAYLPAGTHGLKWWAMSSLGVGNHPTDVIGKIGITNFSDLTGVTLTRVMNQNINAAATFSTTDAIVGVLRECALGTVRAHTIRVNMFIEDSGNTEQGEWDFGTWAADFSCYVGIVGGPGGSESIGDPTYEYEDIDNVENQCNYGSHSWIIPIDDSVNILVNVRNNDVGAHNYNIYYSIVACPWVSGVDYCDPVQLELPQGSTVNATLEPLDQDISKSIGLGKRTAIGLERVYNESTGTGIQAHTDTLNVLIGQSLRLFHKGFGSAVTVIVADRRG